jgi:hypothetical protein
VAIGNSSFAAKAKELKKSAFHLTKEAGAAREWTPTEIEKRQKRLAALAVNDLAD